MVSDAIPFKAVIFDMDGVLIDSEAAYANELIDVFGARGLDVTKDEIYGLVGSSQKTFTSSLARWFARNGLGTMTPDEAVALYYRWTAGSSYDYAALLNPGVPETLAALRERGVRLALASSSPMNNIQDVLGQCGIAGMFEVVVSGEQFHESKPNPKIYLHTMEVLGLPAAACCCVEDSAFGIEAGKRAGLTVIAKREERFGFSQDQADIIVDTIPEVLVAVQLGGKR